jgi:hypothetical protein
VAPAPEREQKLTGPPLDVDAAARVDAGKCLGRGKQLRGLELAREVERRNLTQTRLVAGLADDRRQVDRLERRQCELQDVRFRGRREAGGDAKCLLEGEGLAHRPGAAPAAGVAVPGFTVAVVSSGVALPWIAAIIAGFAIFSSGR